MSGTVAPSSDNFSPPVTAYLGNGHHGYPFSDLRTRQTDPSVLSLLSPADRQISPPPPQQSHLASNNPFRNRTLSPPSNSSRSASKPDRPVSRNPFLDDLSPASATNDKPDVTGNTRELFVRRTPDTCWETVSRALFSVPGMWSRP